MLFKDFLLILMGILLFIMSTIVINITHGQAYQCTKMQNNER